jgi:hypothetical protein
MDQLAEAEKLEMGYFRNERIHGVPIGHKLAKDAHR